MADSRLNVTVNPRGAISGAQKASKALKDLALQAQKTETELNKVGKRPITVKVNARALATLKTTAKSVETSLKNISKITVKPKVNATALYNLRKTAKSVATALRQINRVTAKPKTNLRPVNDLTAAAKRAKASIKAIGKTRASPIINSAGVTALTAAIATLNTSVQALIAQLAVLNGSLVKVGVTGTASMARVATAANAATAAVARLGAVSAGVRGASATGLVSGLRGFTGQAGKASTAAKGLKKSLGLLKGGLIAIGAAVGLAAGTLVATTIKFSDASIMVRNRIRLVTRSTEELNSVTEALFRQSRDARVQLTAQAELYQRIGLSMEQLGASTEQVLAATEATSKAITLSAVSYQAANATIIQFGQALAFGKLRGDELRSVLEQSPRLAQALADGLGIARGELIKFGFAGKLSSERTFNALLSQLPKLREEFKLIKPRISEAANTLENSFIKMSGAINDSTDIGTGFARMILNISDSIDENIPNMLRMILQLQLAWIRASREVGSFFASVRLGFSTMPEAAESVIPDFLSDQALFRYANKPIQFIGDILEKPNFTELNKTSAWLQAYGLAIQFIGLEAGRSIDPVTGLFKALSGGGQQAVDGQKLVNDASRVVEELYAISLKREKLGKLIQARDFAREAQEVAKLPFVKNGIEMTGNIKLEVDAEQAEKEIKEVQAEFDRVKAIRFKADVQINLPKAEKEVQKLEEQMQLALAGGASKDDPYYKERQAEIDLYRKLIKEVTDSGEFIIRTDINAKEVDTLRNFYESIRIARAPVLAPTDLPDPSDRTTLANQRDPTADTRAINSFIESQKKLIIELSTVEGIERELSLLRLEAGNVAVDKSKAQIEANQALIDSLQKVRDLEEEADDYIESLDEQIDKLKERGEAEKLGDFLANNRVRTEAEQDRVDALQEQLIGLVDVDEKTAGYTLTEAQLLAIQTLRAETISAAVAKELRAKFELAKASEDELYAAQQLAEAQDAIRKRAEEGDRTPEGQRLRELEELTKVLRIAQSELERLENLKEKYENSGLRLTAADAQQLEDTRDAVRLFQKDIQELTGVFQDFSVDARELMQETAEQMHSAMEDTFFDAMQGNFDNLLDNLLNSWKAAIDRMVAQALAAELSKKLFSNAEEGSFGQFLGKVFFGLGEGTNPFSTEETPTIPTGTQPQEPMGPPESLANLGGSDIDLATSTQQTVEATQNGANLVSQGLDFLKGTLFKKNEKIGGIAGSVNVTPVMVTKVLLPVSLSQSTIAALKMPSGTGGGGGSDGVGFLQGIGDFVAGIFGGGGGTGGSSGSTGGGGGFGFRAMGGFVSPNQLVEVNELGQEALILGATKFLIPTGEKIARSTPPEIMEQVRGLESGGFARPRETVEVNEKGIEALRMGNITQTMGEVPETNSQTLGGAALVTFPGSFPPPSPGEGSLPRGGTTHFYDRSAAQQLSQDTTADPSRGDLPEIFNIKDRTFMRMGSAGGFVIPHDKTNDMIRKEVTGKLPRREFGGAVQSRSAYEVNEGVLPELLSIGSRDFLLTGGSSGYVSPVDSASELGMSQTINMTIVTPDVDGFRKTQNQLQNEMGRAANLANRRNG